MALGLTLGKPSGAGFCQAISVYGAFTESGCRGQSGLCKLPSWMGLGGRHSQRFTDGGMGHAPKSDKRIEMAFAGLRGPDGGLLCIIAD